MRKDNPEKVAASTESNVMLRKIMSKWVHINIYRMGCVTNEMKFMPLIT